MNQLIVRSTSAEALQAELHRSDLLTEVANSKRARAASSVATSHETAGSTFVRRIRAAFADVGRPAQVECADCA